MSYILDALTKAAQQRDRRIPVVQRLLTPTVRTPRASWTRSLSRLLIALVVNAGLLAVIVFWLLWPGAMSEPPAPVVTTVAPATTPTIVEPRPAATEPQRPVAPELPRAAILTPPRASAPQPVPASPPDTPRAPQPPTAAPRASVPTPPAVAPPAPVATPQAPTPPPPASPPRPASAALPAPLVTSPVAPRAPATAQGRPLRLEALIYSDVPAQRMIFINGRRYVEGDLVEGRLKVEEIKEDGVELSEQGRRVTLRATR